MAVNGSIQIRQLINEFKGLKNNIRVPLQFHRQVEHIDKLLKNDKTGIVCTIMDFMANTANVSMKIETENDTLNTILKFWQEIILNSDIGIDIPRGLKELSDQYYKERWRSSFIGLKVVFEDIDVGINGSFQLPTKMWLVNGGAIDVKQDKTGLGTNEYFLMLNRNKRIPLKNERNMITLIRKPYNLWHETFPTPYLVKHGVLFNAMLKNTIVEKQADVINVIIPYLLTIKSGNDRLAELNMLANEAQLTELKDKLVEKIEDGHISHHSNIADLIASLSYDTNFEHLMPDLQKIFNPEILESVDKNLLSGLGLIELKGFSSTREEAILNPKVLVEEIQDGVDDWSSLLEEVMIETLKRNRRKHPKLVNNPVNVIPGTIKAFITDPMRALIRSLYDRGIVSKRTTVESITDFDFKTEVDRRVVENREQIDDLMYPQIIQNLEQHPNDQDLPDEDILDDRKPGTPEADNFNQAIINYYKSYNKSDIIQTPEGLPEDIKKLAEPLQFIYFLTYNLAIEDDITKEKADKLARESINHSIDGRKHRPCDTDPNKKCPKKKKKYGIFNTIDELPDNVKNVLPITAQMIWLRVFNDTFKRTNDEPRSIATAWSVVGETYKKVPNKKKWVKK